MDYTVADALRARVAADPLQRLVKCGGEWLTAAEVNELSARVAAGLLGLGMRKGDRLLVMLPNRQEMVEVFFACARSGVVQVPVNIYLKGEFLAYQVRDSQSRVAITDRAGLRSLTPLLDQTALEQIVLVDQLDDDDADLAIPVLPYLSLKNTADEAPAVDLTDADLVSILYTSGTTGPSKGCMLSNAYYTVAPKVFLEHHWLAADDRILTPLQLFHGAAHNVLMQGLVAPRGAVCFETSFSASTFMRRAREESATLLWLLPPMAMAVLAQQAKPGDAPLSSVRLVACPGLPLHAQLGFEQRFGGRVGAEMYGQTEGLGIAFGSLTETRRPGTLGRPGPHVEVRIVDDHDRDVAPGEPGEIVVRPRIAHCIYSGYWNNAEATAAAWRNSWHHTGDMAIIDSDGVLTFVDRKKDSLRRRGENVSSFELEAAIGQFSKVSQVAVSAVPSPLGEDDIKASIVLEAGATTSPEEIFEFLRTAVPYFAMPRYIDIRSSLPLTEATARVQKHLLRAEGVTPAMWDLEKLGLAIDRTQRR
ncbi:ATP-dependent acyl-CoA ligase [Mycobacterium saskatchewanense]|uniref:ATP-dependent acyl-CoA ligase n=1 Tax=Mycobacterium saskatchewanense TaxID=220927 RepID=A0AAJ3NSQ9_9MYCO|nr:AMP-binding protein [Mycobacterium saskatchewanense]ORW72914.1 hypothetical protein AWC23_08645 [Mycobacterium saskatchewanense]BBX62558.1 ATP-dependent acyl-CoA ligase [Mycobacterium saskatchewanense]